MKKIHRYGLLYFWERKSRPHVSYCLFPISMFFTNKLVPQSVLVHLPSWGGE